MMPEISLSILDVAENSTKAKASLVTISLAIDTKKDEMLLLIDDNGCGMTKEQVSHVEDPFYTTRTTRKVGLGVPFLKQAAIAAGGEFSISSEVGKGTLVRASFQYSNIDRMPLGDISHTIQQLIVYHPGTDFLYSYSYNGASFTLDTREMREILGDVPFSEPEVMQYILSYLQENKEEVDHGQVI